jgi:hypothetical protein
MVVLNGAMQPRWTGRRSGVFRELYGVQYCGPDPDRVETLLRLVNGRTGEVAAASAARSGTSVRPPEVPRSKDSAIEPRAAASRSSARLKRVIIASITCVSAHLGVRVAPQ